MSFATVLDRIPLADCASRGNVSRSTGIRGTQPDQSCSDLAYAGCDADSNLGIYREEAFSAHQLQAPPVRGWHLCPCLHRDASNAKKPGRNRSSNSSAECRDGSGEVYLGSSTVSTDEFRGNQVEQGNAGNGHARQPQSRGQYVVRLGG